MPELRLSEEAFPTSGAAVASRDRGDDEDETGSPKKREGGREAEGSGRIDEVVAEEIAEEVVAEVELEEVELEKRRRVGGSPTSFAEEQAVEAASEQSDSRLPRPLAVAITGGIGAGKSTALESFADTARRPCRATRSSITSLPRIRT